jgi:hypothetical protein
MNARVAEQRKPLILKYGGRQGMSFNKILLNSVFGSTFSFVHAFCLSLFLGSFFRDDAALWWRFNVNENDFDQNRGNNPLLPSIAVGSGQSDRCREESDIVVLKISTFS